MTDISRGSRKFWTHRIGIREGTALYSSVEQRPNSASHDSNGWRTLPIARRQPIDFVAEEANSPASSWRVTARAGSLLLEAGTGSRHAASAHLGYRAAA